jgi:DNA repair protein RecN (Recombination protein N)
MLDSIQISDFALIDSAYLDFNKGFTVFSGETGAGKSILIGAVSFLLGGKGGVELIREGSNEAKVSGTVTFNKNNLPVIQWLEEHGIETEENMVLLRRSIKQTGKSYAWIQDTPVTRNELSDFTQWFIDIHGQHEHQSLLKVSEHRCFLDSFAGINDEVSSFTALYAELVDKRKYLTQLQMSDTERSNKIDLLSYAVEEIESAQLESGEDIELEVEEKKLSQYEKLYQSVENVSDLFSGDESNTISVLKKINTSVSSISEMDTTLNSLAKRMENVFYEVEDIYSEIKSYKQSLVFDPQRYEEVQERLALLFRLKKKYGSGSQSSVDDIISYGSSAKEELTLLQSSDSNKKELEEAIRQLEKKVYEVAKNLSEKRKIASKNLSQQVTDIISELGMKNAVFQVSVQQKQFEDTNQKCGPYGIDDIEFMISANPGSPVKPLAKIASGGELSRVMLALKTVLGETDSVETMIFDEIDTGIGGEVAVSVGQHIKKLAAKKQIFCITHLASIAVYADTQIKIEKSVKNQETSTYVHEITGEQRVEEIARMLSGDAVNEVSREHARSLLHF